MYTRRDCDTIDCSERNFRRSFRVSHFQLSEIFNLLYLIVLFIILYKDLQVAVLIAILVAQQQQTQGK